MKKLTVLIAALVIISLLGSAAVSCAKETAPAGKATVLRLAIPWPPGDFPTNNIQAFVDKFNAQAAGKYVIELHPGESLVKIPDSVDALRTGATEMSAWPIAIFSSLDPVFAAAELPFAANNIEADAAMTAEVMPLYDAVMTKKFNSKPLFVFTVVALDIISTKPIKTRADFKGVLTQAVSPQAGKFIELMGGSSVPMPFPDAYQGLQKKVIEASMLSSPMIIMFKLHEVAKYYTRGYLIPASVVVAINKGAYDKMPKDIQDLIVKLGVEAQASTNKNFIALHEETLKTMAERGMTVYRLPKTERDAWATTIQPYQDQLLTAMGADTAKKIRGIIADLNKKYPYKE